MSQRHHAADIAFRWFSDVCPKLNMQKQTFQYFIHTFGGLKLKMLPHWWSKIENNRTVMCFLIYFQIDVWGRPEFLNLLWGKLLWQRKWYLRKNWPFFKYRGDRNISIYIWLTFSHKANTYQIFHESNRVI